MEQEKFKRFVYEYMRLISLYLNHKKDDSFIVDKERVSFLYGLAK